MFRKTTVFSVMAVAVVMMATSIQAAIIYSIEDFEDEPVGLLPDTPNGTDYVRTASSKVEIAGNITNGNPGAGSEPTGQHGLVRGDNNKHMTLTEPMTLVTDGVTSLEISLAIYFNKTGNGNRFELWYSALGDFTDKVSIQIFNPTGTFVPENYEYENLRWYADQRVTIADTDVTFTDTAKIRWAKRGTGQSNRVYFDDVVITGIGGVPAQAGDFNLDSQVEQTDLNLLLANWGASAVPPEWTADFDGLVDQSELNDLLANWGAGVSGADALGAAETVVPEPVTAGLLLLGGLAVLRRRRA